VILASSGYQVALGSVGAVLILTGIIVHFRAIKKIKKDRLISFQNPDGEVTISISAIEDYIRKVAKEIKDISHIKSRVSFSRKGIRIFSEVTIRAGSNIPAVTEQIQMEVRNKVQSMLGVEEKIELILHINKIIGDKQDKDAGDFEKSEPMHIPFR